MPLRPTSGEPRDVHQWIAEHTREVDDTTFVDWIEERWRTEVDRLILDWIRRTDRRDPR